MANLVAKQIFAKHTEKQREKEWNRYLKRTKGGQQMNKRRWYKFNYNAEPPARNRTEQIVGQIIGDKSLTEEEMQRFQGKRR